MLENSNEYINLVEIGDNPFLDIANLYMPDNIKEAFQLSRIIFYRNGVVRQAVKKLAEYAITDLEYEAEVGEDKLVEKEKIENKYKEIFEDVLGIKRFLIKVGIDHYVYGNAFVSIYFPFKRILKCKECEKHIGDDEIPAQYTLDDISDWDYSSGKYKGTCPRCKKKVEFSAQDETMQEDAKIRLIRWNPEDMDVKFFPYSGERIYLYNDNITLRDDRDFIRRTPAVVLKSFDDNKTLEMSDNTIFHFVADGPSDSQPAFGKPVVLCSFTNIFYSTLLRKGSEAIAREHIVPLRVVFPQISGSEGLFSSDLPMNAFQTRIKNEFISWKQDPNHIMIMPIPVGMQYLGGQGRSMLPTPELQYSNEEVFMSFGIPQSVVMGQANWASNSIAMRMMENQFLTYRDQIQEMLVFIKDKIRTYLDLPNCEVRMKEFKMIDDIQHKMNLINLASVKMISKERVLDAFGFDVHEEEEKIESEALKEARTQANAQAEMIKIQNEMQVKINEAQTAQMYQQQMDQMENMSREAVSQIERFMNFGMPLEQAVNVYLMQQQQIGMMMEQQMMAQQAQMARDVFLQDRMASSQWSLARAQKQLQMYDMMKQMLPIAPNPQSFRTEAEYVNSLVSYLMQLDPATRDQQLSSIQNQDSALHARIVNYLTAIGASPDNVLTNTPMPLPEKSAPSEMRR